MKILLIIQLLVFALGEEDMPKQNLAGLSGPILRTAQAMEATEGVLKIPSLGREFMLGALYDARSETVISGPKPWTDETITAHTSERPAYFTDANFTVGDSFDSKFQLLDLGAEITASFLGGLVDVSGSAKFLYEKSHSNYEASVTYWLKKETHFKVIRTEEIAVLDNPKVFTNYPTATHVVTAIKYGGKAFFRFSQQTNSLKDKKQVEGSLKIAATFEIATISGGGHLNLTDDEKMNYSKISCRFTGDMNLETTPTTFVQALEVIGKIPSSITKETAVPVLVTLLPVKKFDSELNRIIVRIDDALLRLIKDRMNAYDRLEQRIGDVRVEPAYKMLSFFQRQVHQFIEAFQRKHNYFQGEIGEKLPELRKGNTVVKGELRDVLDESNTIYTLNKLRNWVDHKRRESGALKHVVVYNPNLIIADEMKLNELFYGSETEYVVSFVINLYHKNDKFTQCVNHNCEPEASSTACKLLGCDDTTFYNSWLKTSDMKRKLHHVFDRFTELVEVNNYNESDPASSTKFIMQPKEIEKEGQPDFRITVYEYGGDVVLESFTPPVVTDVQMNAGNCSGTTVSWKINVDQPSNDLVDGVLIQYASLDSPKDVKIHTVGVEEDGYFVPLVQDFSIQITVKCKFGKCSKTHSELFQGPIPKECKKHDGGIVNEAKCNALTERHGYFDEACWVVTPAAYSSYEQAAGACTLFTGGHLAFVYHAEHAAGVDKLLNATWNGKTREEKYWTGMKQSEWDESWREEGLYMGGRGVWTWQTKDRYILAFPDHPWFPRLFNSDPMGRGSCTTYLFKAILGKSSSMNGIYNVYCNLSYGIPALCQYHEPNSAWTENMKRKKLSKHNFSNPVNEWA